MEGGGGGGDGAGRVGDRGQEEEDSHLLSVGLCAVCHCCFNQGHAAAGHLTAAPKPVLYKHAGLGDQIDSNCNLLQRAQTGYKQSARNGDDSCDIIYPGKL